MNIKTVKLRAAGFNGAEIHHFVEVIKQNRKTIKPVKEYPKDPIHKDLENLFKDLRIHFLDICRMNHPKMDETDRRSLIIETAVTGVDFDSDGFVLHGEVEIVTGKSLKFSTPKIEESDDYGGFEEVMEIVRNIATESKLYLAGEKKVSDLEVAQRYLESGRNKGMSVAQFNEMSDEDQQDFATKLLENKFGAVVIPADVPEEEAEPDEEFTVGNEGVNIPSAPIKK